MSLQQLNLGSSRGRAALMLRHRLDHLLGQTNLTQMGEGSQSKFEHQGFGILSKAVAY
jgi:hypothetical protein